MMGRMTAYDQYGRMVSDFDKSDYDFLLRYGRTPEEVLDENAKLRELVRNALTALVNNCAKCAYRDGCTILQDCKCRAPERLLEDMHELGVEVDG